MGSLYLLLFLYQNLDQPVPLDPPLPSVPVSGMVFVAQPSYQSSEESTNLVAWLHLFFMTPHQQPEQSR